MAVAVTVTVTRIQRSCDFRAFKYLNNEVNASVLAVLNALGIKYASNKQSAEKRQCKIAGGPRKLGVAWQRSARDVNDNFTWNGNEMEMKTILWR